MSPVIETQQNKGKTEIGNSYGEHSAKEQTKEAQTEALRRAPELVKSAEQELERVAVRTKAAGIGHLIELSRPETQRICAELGLSSSQTAYVEDMVEQKLTAVYERTESQKAHKEKETSQSERVQVQDHGMRSVDRLFGGAEQQPQPFTARAPDAVIRFDAKPYIKVYGETLESSVRQLLGPSSSSVLDISHRVDDALTVDRSCLEMSPDAGHFLALYFRNSRYWPQGKDLRAA